MFFSSNFHNLKMACIYIIRQEQEDLIEIDFIFWVRWENNSETQTHVRADLVNANSLAISDLADFSMKILVPFSSYFQRKRSHD